MMIHELITYTPPTRINVRRANTPRNDGHHNWVVQQGPTVYTCLTWARAIRTALDLAYHHDALTSNIINKHTIGGRRAI